MGSSTLLQDEVWFTLAAQLRWNARAVRCVSVFLDCYDWRWTIARKVTEDGSQAFALIRICFHADI